MVKKNGAKIYRGRQVLTPQYRAWEQVAELFVRKAAAERNNLPIEKNVRMEAIFCFENHQSEPDLSALYEGIQDLLQKCGVLKNDRQIYSHNGSTKLFGEAPSMQVTIFTLGPE